MKKNKMMRLASFLLVAVLLTTSIISGTFAKYVTVGSATDTARVAKFGVQINASGALFDKNYMSVGNGNGLAGTQTDDGNVALTVESTTDKLVAPGTNGGNGVSFSISGTPEVDVQVTFDIDIKEEVFLKAENYPDMTTANPDDRFTLTKDYYPIVFTLKQGNNVLATGTSKEIANALKNATVYYDAGTNLGDVTTANAYTLTWEWAYEQTADKDMYNKADTLLGDLAAGTATLGADYCNLKVDVEFTVTVTQVD